MKKLLLSLTLLLIGCLSAVALEITSIVPNPSECDGKATVYWTGGPSSGIELITFSFKNYKEVWRVYDMAQYSSASSSYTFMYNSSYNPETIYIKMYDSTDESKTPVATAEQVFNDYPYAISQSLFYDYCNSCISLNITTQRIVSELNEEYMVAELYNQGGTLLKTISQKGYASADLTFQFKGVTYDAAEKYYAVTYATDKNGKIYNICGERVTQTGEVTGSYNLNILSAVAVAGSNRIDIKYTGAATCSAVTVKLVRIDGNGVSTQMSDFTYIGGSSEGTYSDLTVEKCLPYAYQLKAYDAAGNIISQSNMTENISLSEHPERAIEYSNTYASLGEYADKVLLQWEMTNSSYVKQVAVKRAVSTNPTQFTTIYSSDKATHKNSVTDNTVSMGAYYIYRIDITNTDDCLYSSPLIAGFASANATVSGRITYADDMGTPDVQVKACLSDESAKFVSQGSFSAFGQSVGAVTFKEAFTSNVLTWQGWIKSSKAQKSVLYRQVGMFRIVTENNSVKVTTDDDAMNSIVEVALDDAGIYHQVTFTYNAGNAALYIDGKLAAEANGALTSGTSTGAYFMAADENYLYGASGNIDDVRLWNIEVDSDEVLRNFQRVLSGTESGLYSYWKFDEIGLSVFVDYAHNESVGYMSNHGRLTGVNTFSTDVPDGLHCLGYTDETGYYKIYGIPMEAAGTTYKIVPYKDGAIFSPTNSLVMFDQYNALAQNFDFTDESAYQVYVHVMYKGTKVPVKGVTVTVDGKNASDESAFITTDVEGYAAVSVSKGVHTIGLMMDGHTFSAIDGVGGGSYTGSFHADVEKAYAIELTDSTTVRVLGRIAGGSEEGEKPVGFGESENNIGAEEMVLRFKNADLATCSLFDDGRTEETVTNETKQLESFWVDEPHYSATPANKTTITKRKNGSVWEWVVTPDANSGEYILDLYPEEYQVYNIDYFHQPGGGSLDYSASFTPSVDTLGQYTQEIERSIPVLDYKGQDIGEPDSLVTLTERCDYLQNYLLYNGPTINVYQNNIDGLEYFGSKEYSIGEDNVLLYNDTTKRYLVYYGDPVFIQNEQYSLHIQAKEVYYSSEDESNEYDFSKGYFTIINEFGHISEPFTVTGRGEFDYNFVASEPRFDTGDYRKYLKIFLTSDNVDYYWEPDLGVGNDECVDNQMPGVVIGAISDPSTQFTTKGPDKIAFVLRDPPGNQSFSSLAAGTSYTYSYSAKDSRDDYTIRGSWNIAGGYSNNHMIAKPDAGKIGEAGEVEVDEKWTVTATGGVPMEWEYYDYETASYCYTSEVSSEITSCTSDSVTCASGDVYVGNSTNLIFSDSRHLDIKIVGQNIPELYEYNKYDAIDSIGTQFLYTQSHIVNDIIPKSQTFIDDNLIYDKFAGKYKGNESELFSHYPDDVDVLYLTSFTKGEKQYGTLGSYYMYCRPYTGTHADEIAFYIQSIDNWEKTVAANEAVKLDAINGGTGWTKQNYSFNGGHSMTKSTTFSFSTDSVHTRGFEYYAGIMFGVDFTVGSFTMNTDYSTTWRADAGYMINKPNNSEYSTHVDLGDGIDDFPSEESELEEGKGGEITLSYTLEDDNPKNKYTVDVYTPDWLNEKTLLVKTTKGELVEQVCGLRMPVFVLRAGTTSCIHFNGDSTLYQEKRQALNAQTKRGQMPKILVNGMEMQSFSGLEPDAIVPLEITVAEESTDAANICYGVYFESGNGAVNINADSYSLEPCPIPGEPEYINVYLEHLRPDVTDDIVGVIVYSQCQYAPEYNGAEQIYDEAYILLNYQPEAPVPALDYISKSNVVNIENDEIELNISKYGADYKNLTDLVLEYRGESDVQWQTKYYFALTKEEYEEQKSVYGDKIRLVAGQDSINYTFSFTEADGDGKYMTRVRADLKANGVVLDSKYSPTVDIVKDVNAPYVISVSPSDGIQSIGESVGLQTNEDIYITNIISDKISVTGVLNGQIDKEGNDCALQFNGTDMNAKTEYQYNLYDRSFTIDTWVWYNGTPGVIYSQGRAGDAWFELAVNSNSNLEVRVLQNGVTNTYTLNETLKSDQWTHIAALYDNDLKRVDFLQADAAAAEQLDTRGFNKNVTPYDGYTQNYSAVGSVYLASDVSSAQNFSGRLRDLRLWNRALTSAEIAANRAVMLSGSEIGLLGYWRMDELDGTTAVDKAQAHTLSHNATWYLYPGGYAITSTPTDTLLFTSPGLNVEDYTFEFWYKSSGETDGYLLKRLTDNELLIGVKSGKLVVNTSLQHKTLDGADYLDGVWHHFAIASAHYGDAKFYIDGKLVFSCLASEAGAMDSKYEMGVGVAATFDNVRVWTAELDAAAIKSNMHKRSASSDDELADYFPFDKMNDLNIELIPTGYSIAGAGGKVTILSAEAKDSTLFYTTEAALINAKINDEKVIPTVIREQRGMTLTFDEFENKPYRLQDCELSVTVNSDAIKDLHGNYMASDKQWSVFVDNKRLVWNTDEVELEKSEGEELEFTASFYNRYGQTQNFSIENLPSWLCASSDLGTLSPLATKKVRFTVDPALPIGDYEEVVYLRGDGNLTDKFTLTLKCRDDAPVWIPQCKDSDNATALIASVKVKGYYPDSEENMLGAFVGDKCIGVSTTTESAKGLYMMSICAKSTDNVEFRYWDATTGTLFTKLTPDRELIFGDVTLIGSPKLPVEFTASDNVSIEVPMKSGYNWVSVNVYADNATDIPKLFEYDNSVLSIKNQVGDIAMRSSAESSWFVTLKEVEPSQMYSVVCSLPDVWSVPGVAVNPADVKIKVRGTSEQQKWSWIGYTPSVAMSVKEAMSLHTPKADDIIKSQTGFAVYDEDYGWVGTLTTMEPGKGYKYCSSQDTTFVYPAASASLRSATAELSEKHFQYDPYLYPNSMSVIAVINSYTIVEGDEIGWFAGEECRGGATVAKYGERYLFYGQVYGNSDGQLITAKLYNSTTGKEEQLSNVITFSSDAIIGTLSAPFEYSLGPVSAAEVEADAENQPYKIIKDNQVFIIRDGKMYNILGIETDK